MCTKSYISMLEELAAAKIIEKPQYSISLCRNGFLCEVKCGDVIASSVACSKKLAKHDCATQAWLKLQCTVKDVNIIKGLNGYTPNEECTINAVGQLNEMCSQNVVPYPVYNCCGLENGNFIIECKCLTYVTVGQSTTKKQAKQLAAMEMLHKLQPSDFENVNGNGEDDSRVLELIKALGKTFTTNPKMEDVRSKCEDPPLSSFEVSNTDNVDDLSRKLDALGVTYNVKVLQDCPLLLIMTATISNGEKYTFLESRGNFAKCHTQILRSALDAITILTN